MPEKALECTALSKQFENVQALKRVSLSLAAGEILAIVGPSGCGKTTLLRLIAGFERPDSGEIELFGRCAAGAHTFIPPEQRGVGMVFQDYALFPHLNVQQNVSFGLHRLQAAERAQRTAEVLQLVGLGDYTARYPHELSGGERQRVALARALAPRPGLLLLDEPFSSLDADLRIQMRQEVRELLKRLGITAVFVTHDQEEALAMGDRLAVLNCGRLEQMGTPETVFHQPQTRFVAEFMGQADFIPGRVTAHGIQTEIGMLPQRVDLPPGEWVELALRADDINFQPCETASSRIVARQFKGASILYRLELPSGRVLHSEQPHTRILPAGIPVEVFPDAGHDLACFYRGKALQEESGRRMPAAAP
ncbi:MAG: ABC transporter ATP-binding protein [Chloroflexi bacterium]|jgi:iron(III) transport system ATP-binding protein|nr:ABC transporter ATP-binding protein [Chloroflexota bacterium]